jgi:hypothetical protein
VPAEKLAAARALLAPKLEAACREPGAPALAPWLRALGRDPRLLERLGDSDDEHRWSLLWAAVKAQSYTQAELSWAPLARRVRDEAPQLAAAIEALLAACGKPDPSVIPRSSPGDDRLGVEPIRARPALAPAPPRELDEVEPRLLELRACAGWSRFAELGEKWLGRVQERCAARMCAPLAELSLLELSEAEPSAGRKRDLVGLILAADRRFSELQRATPASVEQTDQQRLDRALELVLRVAWRFRHERPPGNREWRSTGCAV